MGKGVLASLRGESNDPFTLNDVKGGSRVLARVAAHGKKIKINEWRL